MFKLSLDERISSWAEFRAHLKISADPLQEVIDFWQAAPYTPYNRHIDPYHKKDWPTPWEIIEENRYDDFTKAVMIGWTLKYSDLYKNSRIEIRTMVDKTQNSAYNLVCIDEHWVINYSDNGVNTVDSLPGSFYLENIIELEIPR